MINDLIYHFGPWWACAIVFGGPLVFAIGGVILLEWLGDDDGTQP